MDELYAAGLRHPTREASRGAIKPSDEEIFEAVKDVETKKEANGAEGQEIMLLQRWNGKLIAEDFKLAEMEIEIERAVEQVEKAIFGDKKKMEEGKSDQRSGAQDVVEKSNTSTAGSEPEPEIRRAKR